MTARSSFDTRREGSRIAGEGDNVGLGASLSERDLLDLGVISPSSCWLRFDMAKLPLARLVLVLVPVLAPEGAAMVVVDTIQTSLSYDMLGHYKLVVRHHFGYQRPLYDYSFRPT